MKLTLYLVVIAMASVSLAQDDSNKSMGQYKTCMAKCEEEYEKKKDEVHKIPRLCAEGGYGFENRCVFDCVSKFHPSYQGIEVTEVECKPGSYGYCWNVECKEEERKFIARERDLMCVKEPPHYYSNLPCRTKCYAKTTEKKELQFVPCSDVKPKKLVSYELSCKEKQMKS